MIFSQSAQVRYQSSHLWVPQLGFHHWMRHFYFFPFFLKIGYNLVVILEAINCSACSSMAEGIDINGYMYLFGSLWTKWFNHVKVDEDIVVSVKIGNMVRFSYILANEFKMD